MSFRDTFLLLCFEYISEPVLYYFYLSKEVESVSLLSSEFYFTAAWVKYVCTSTTSGVFS